MGEIVKLFWRFSSPQFSHGINIEQNRNQRVVVSLTSFGRRVSSVLPFAIYSLLRQTYKPDEIVLWLDWDNWADDKIPKRLKRLQENGVLTIRYCKDIKSCKKLIAALAIYPNDIIITVDDDLYYKKDMIERLIDSYNKYPQCIITHRAHGIKIHNGKLSSYNDWNDEISDSQDELVFPTGGAGCLYRTSMLYKDVVNEDLFMKLCPLADDVWFFFMEILNGTKRVVLEKRGYLYIPLDNFYQYFHKNSNLSNHNCHDNQNDVQIKAIMNYYRLVIKNNKIVRDDSNK